MPDPAGQADLGSVGALGQTSDVTAIDASVGDVTACEKDLDTTIIFTDAIDACVGEVATCGSVYPQPVLGNNDQSSGNKKHDHSHCSAGEIVDLVHVLCSGNCWNATELTWRTGPRAGSPVSGDAFYESFVSKGGPSLGEEGHAAKGSSGRWAPISAEMKSTPLVQGIEHIQSSCLGLGAGQARVL